MNTSEREQKPDNTKNRVGENFLYSALMRVIVGIVTVFLAGLIAKWISEPILSSIGLGEHVAKAIRYILSLVAILSAYYWLFTFYEKRKVTELAKQYFIKDTLLGITLGSLSVSVVMLVLYLAGYYQVVSINSNVLLLLFPLTAYTLTATLEELIFRGIFYRIVESKLGINLTRIISGSIFGFLHLSNEHATMVSVLGAGIGGLTAGTMFSVTIRLWLPISFHAIWIFMQVFYGASMSGMDEFVPYSLFQGRLQGPDIMTSGFFGPENSIITILLTFILFVVFYYVTWKKGRLIIPFWKNKEQA